MVEHKPPQELTYTVYNNVTTSLQPDEESTYTLGIDYLTYNDRGVLKNGVTLCQLPMTKVTGLSLPSSADGR